MSEYGITTDGRTVWVNGPNGLIGRFSKFGIDVHNEDNTGCLACTSGPCGLLEWELFKSAMLEHRGIVVHDEWMPHYLKEQQA